MHSICKKLNCKCNHLPFHWHELWNLCGSLPWPHATLVDRLVCSDRWDTGKYHQRRRSVLLNIRTAVIIFGTRPTTLCLVPDHSRVDMEYNSSWSDTTVIQALLISYQEKVSPEHDLFVYELVHLHPPTQTDPQRDWDWTVAKQRIHIFGQLLCKMCIYLYVSIYCASSEIWVCWEWLWWRCGIQMSWQFDSQYVTAMTAGCDNQLLEISERRSWTWIVKSPWDVILHISTHRTPLVQSNYLVVTNFK